MVATTDRKARMFDLTTGVMELVRDGNRSIDEVCDVLQIIKDDSDFAARLLAKNSTTEWPIWRTLTIGGKTQKQLREELKRGGFRISDWASDIMSKPAFTPLTEPREVKLVRVKVEDLGFTEMPMATQLYARAKERGLKLCPAEVGPHLRLNFKDQPNNDWFWIAMEPITASDGVPGVFAVELGSGGLWLNAYYAYPESQWYLGDEIVFCLRK